MKKINESKIKTMVQIGKISYNLLHDLLSPITGLGLYLETTEDENLKDFFEQIKESSENIRKFISLVQDVIDCPNKFSRINLDETVRHAVSLSKNKAIKSGVSIVIANNTPLDTRIYCRKLEIYQIVMNLVGNAIDSFDGVKRDKKVVSVSITENFKNFQINVVDNGSGINKRDQKKIFKKRYTTKKHGMGIGLSVVRKAVKIGFSGKIKVKSFPNKGTEFYINLPKKNILGRRFDRISN